MKHGSLKTGRSFLPKLILTFISLIVSLLAVEAACRMILPQAGTEDQRPSILVHQASVNRTLLYQPVPGAENRAYGVLNGINRHGFRDRDFELRKAPGTKRVIFLGDSVVYGIGLDQEKTLPKQLEQIWRKAGIDVEVLNLGVSGYDTEQQVEFFKSVGRQFNPDLVILGYTLNDSIYASMEADLLHDQADYRLKIERPEWRKKFWALLFRHSRLMQFLDQRLGLQRNHKNFRTYREESIWDYLEKRYRENSDTADSAYRQLQGSIEADAQREGLSPGVTRSLLGVLGIGNDPIFSSHWNLSRKAIETLKGYSSADGFKFAAVISPYNLEMNRYALGSAHTFLKEEFQKIGVDQVVDLQDFGRGAVSQYGATADGPFSDAVHFSPLGAALAAEYLAGQIQI